MTLFAFDAGQDWSSTDIALWLYVGLPFLLVYAWIFGILAYAMRGRKKHQETQKEIGE